MSVMLYPCMLCVALSMCRFVLCVACLTVFVNCLVKQFAMCLGVVAILLLNVMEVFSVCGGVQRMLHRKQNPEDMKIIQDYRHTQAKQRLRDT